MSEAKIVNGVFNLRREKRENILIESCSGEERIINSARDRQFGN